MILGKIGWAENKTPKRLRISIKTNDALMIFSYPNYPTTISCI